MKNLRIFWTCELIQGATGYYYHKWRNFLWGIEKEIFAGYNSKGLRSKKNTFKDAIS